MMQLEFLKTHKYDLITESKIVTKSSALYKALDLDFNRTAAIKCVAISGYTQKEKALNLEKAMLEVKAMVNIGEQCSFIPNIYETYFDDKESVLYIVMQWIKGNNLSEKMFVPELEFIGYMIKLCDILIIMERSRLYHKDIKPSNIMITPNGDLFLIDFNISIATPNLIEGTVNYKAPEMDANSKYVGREKVDIFAIGVMIYEFYTGSVPIKTVDYAKNRQRGSFDWDVFIEPKEKAELMDKSINDIAVRCMKLNPKDRYRNCADLKNALKNAEWSIRCSQKKKK